MAKRLTIKEQQANLLSDVRVLMKNNAIKPRALCDAVNVIVEEKEMGLEPLSIRKTHWISSGISPGNWVLDYPLREALASILMSKCEGE